MWMTCPEFSQQWNRSTLHRENKCWQVVYRPQQRIVVMCEHHWSFKVIEVKRILSAMHRYLLDMDLSPADRLYGIASYIYNNIIGVECKSNYRSKLFGRGNQAPVAQRRKYHESNKQTKSDLEIPLDTHNSRVLQCKHTRGHSHCTRPASPAGTESHRFRSFFVCRTLITQPLATGRLPRPSDDGTMA
jgi:hypothetical protein